MLHIAPEMALTHRFRQINNLDYISIDLYDHSAMIKMDITDLQFPDAYFDVIYCSHVLEHVKDDQKAMLELLRVLHPDGWAVLLVPITSKVTIEDPSITDPIERERLFGQYDHVRRYGPDIQDRLKAAGFKVTILKTGDLAGTQEIQRMGLSENDRLYVCSK